VNSTLRIDVVWLFGLGLAFAVAWCVSTGLWMGAAVMIAGIGVLLCAMVWPGLLPSVWVLGTPTLFVIVDNALTGIPLLTVERALFFVIALLMAIRFCRTA